MLELVRGYAAAGFDAAGTGGGMDRAVSDLAGISQLFIRSEALRLALTDASINPSDRAAVVEGLLSGKVSAEVVAIVSFAVRAERAADVPKNVEQLLALAEIEATRRREGKHVEPETPMGRTGTCERIRGCAEWEFERLADPDEVDEVEDELFRLARILDQNPELTNRLADSDVPLYVRLAILHDLLAAKVRPATLRLVSYVLRAGRSRAVSAALDYLVELAAAERGRRVAEVRAAVDLTDEEQARLARALSRVVRRPVEIRLLIDPAVIGGLEVQIGDTIIDGTVRHRLDRLRETLLQRV